MLIVLETILIIKILIWYSQNKNHLNKTNLEINIIKCLKLYLIIKLDKKNYNIEKRKNR